VDALETMFVTPIPIPSSNSNLVRVSFVILFLGSFDTTSPTGVDSANDLVSLGSDSGLSLLV
jgi:hypothetical protein